VGNLVGKQGQGGGGIDVADKVPDASVGRPLLLLISARKLRMISPVDLDWRTELSQDPRLFDLAITFLPGAAPSKGDSKTTA